MQTLRNLEVWFVTGSQHLYGPDTLKQVEVNSKQIAQAFNLSSAMPCQVIYKPILTTPDQITTLCAQANNSPQCIGLITWMHTFSPAKMWIAGLSLLQKPFAHLHTQFNRDIPWDNIDMDFMNLNQAAHGGREFGFMCTRLRKNRKIIVGHWQQDDLHQRLAAWMRAAAGYNEIRHLNVCRFGDNMRQVAVTEGDKVQAQIQFGLSVNGYGVGDLAAAINDVTDAQTEALLAQYKDQYQLKDAHNASDAIRQAARIEAGMKAFLQHIGSKAFTTTFEDLHGLVQLPGLAVQRLMAQGYGFGAEGDWKTAALVRAMKVMAAGLKGGTSFMEAYTYQLDPDLPRVLGAHMLEVCPSIAQNKPSLEVHPLGIGGKADPVRVVFNVAPGPALNATLIDMGNRFRMVVNPVDVVKPDADLPKLPVARAVWIPRPGLQLAVAAWILAGGAHHTGFSTSLTPEHLEDFAEMAGIEYLCIDEQTTLAQFKQNIRTNEVYYMLANAMK